MLGNIKFIGELFSFKILNEKIMHECASATPPTHLAVHARSSGAHAVTNPRRR